MLTITCDNENVMMKLDGTSKTISIEAIQLMKNLFAALEEFDSNIMGVMAGAGHNICNAYANKYPDDYAKACIRLRNVDIVNEKVKETHTDD